MELVLVWRGQIVLCLHRGYMDVCERDILLFMDFGVYSEIGVWPIASGQKTSGGLALRDMALKALFFVWGSFCSIKSFAYPPKYKHIFVTRVQLILKLIKSGFSKDDN